jgi:hypothetical protein
MQVVLTVNIPSISGQNGSLRAQHDIANMLHAAADRLEFSNSNPPTPYTRFDLFGNTMYSWVVTAT